MIVGAHPHVLQPIETYTHAGRAQHRDFLFAGQFSYRTSRAVM